MNKNLRTLIVLFLIVGSFFIIKPNQYEQFYPIVWKAEYDGLVIDDLQVPENFYSNLEKVLEYYNEDYKIEGGIIYVKRTLYNDMDLCWNYTSKAVNKTWLHNQQ